MLIWELNSWKPYPNLKFLILQVQGELLITFLSWERPLSSHRVCLFHLFKKLIQRRWRFHRPPILSFRLRPHWFRINLNKSITNTRIKKDKMLRFSHNFSKIRNRGQTSDSSKRKKKLYLLPLWKSTLNSAKNLWKTLMIASQRNSVLSNNLCTMVRAVGLTRGFKRIKRSNLSELLDKRHQKKALQLSSRTSNRLFLWSVEPKRLTQSNFLRRGNHLHLGGKTASLSIPFHSLKWIKSHQQVKSVMWLT